jgi:hypothetical protein
MPMSLDYLAKLLPPSRCLVETGTLDGTTAALAMAFGYDRIHTIEYAHDKAIYAQWRFAYTDIIEVHEGDSRIVLPELLKTLPGAGHLFWLDAHGGEEAPPLIDELMALKYSGRQGDTIAIDDIRLIRSHGDWGRNLHLQDVEAAVKAINANFKIEYWDDPWGQGDILVARA